MLDITDLLHSSIELDHQISYDRQIAMKPEKSLENVYVALDVELAEIANTAEWFKVWKTHKGKADEGKTKRETLLGEYVDAMDFFLLASAKHQWTHLIVLDRDGIEKIKAAKAAPQDLNKEYLAIKHMLNSAYFEHRQDDFKHAWKLFLKLGLVEFGYSENEIMTAFKNKNVINQQRQQNDY